MSNPEINQATGTKSWYNYKNQRHRLGGPAVEFKSGRKAWFINGKFIYRLLSDGRTVKAKGVDFNTIPKVMKQSIAIEVLKLKADE